jgi:hypothetical protein
MIAMARWDDESLVRELRDAFGTAVSDRGRADARAAFVWRTVDQELMLLGRSRPGTAGGAVGGGVGSTWPRRLSRMKTGPGRRRAGRRLDPTGSAGLAEARMSWQTGGPPCPRLW